MSPPRLPPPDLGINDTTPKEHLMEGRRQMAVVLPKTEPVCSDENTSVGSKSSLEEEEAIVAVENKGPLGENAVVRRLRPGRFSMECVVAANVRRKDQTTTAANLRTYLLFKFGSDLDSNTTASKRTKDYSVSRTSTLDFSNQILSFDIQEPKDLRSKE